MNISMKGKQKNRLTDTENRLLAAKEQKCEEGKDWKFGISTYKRLDTGWINNEGLL